MKKFLKRTCILLIVSVLALSAVGCSVPESDVLAPDVNKVKAYAQYTYSTKLVNNDKTSVEYDTVYTITKETEKGIDIIVVNNDAVNDTQQLKVVTKLLGQTKSVKNGEATPFMPISVSLKYTDSANPKNDSFVDANHDFDNERFEIIVKQFENENADEMKEKKYVVTSAKQYYDSDTLPFMLSTLPLEVGYKINFMMSSSNRDALQSMNLNITEEREVEVPAGKFNCYVAVIRPNTPFTNYASYMYFAKDHDNMLVQISQTNTSFQLKSFTFEKPEA